VERSALSLGPLALAARKRLLAELGGPGERLGAERELAERLGVSRSTIRAALADLERGGAIRRSRGRGGGIFVAER
jgi:GntR family transcriptional regulator